MSALQIFQYNQATVRTIQINNESWFVAMDVSTILDYSETSKMLSLVDDDDKQIINPQKSLLPDEVEPFNTNASRVSVVNESGLYACIFGSTKPNAKQFKKWVTSEVLPQIRKTGSYVSPAIANVEMSKMFGSIMTELQQLRERTDKVEKLELELEETKDELDFANNLIEEDEKFKEETKEKHPGISGVLFNHPDKLTNVKFPISCKEYLESFAEELDLTGHANTISKRAAQFYRVGKQKDPDKKGNYNVYNADEINYIKEAVKSLLKEIRVI